MKRLFVILILIFAISFFPALASSNGEFRFMDVDWWQSTLAFRNDVLSSLGIESDAFKLSILTSNKCAVLNPTTGDKETIELGEEYTANIYLLEYFSSGSNARFEDQPIDAIVIRTLPISKDNKAAIKNHPIISEIEISLNNNNNPEIYMSLLEKYNSVYGQAEYSTDRNNIWFGKNETYLRIVLSERGGITIFYGMSDSLKLCKELISPEDPNSAEVDIAVEVQAD